MSRGNATVPAWVCPDCGCGLGVSIRFNPALEEQTGRIMKVRCGRCGREWENPEPDDPSA